MLPVGVARLQALHLGEHIRVRAAFQRKHPAHRRDPSGVKNQYIRATMGRRLLLTYGVLGFAFLYLPIAFLVLFSFNDYIIPSLPFRGFTLKWYRELGFDFVLHEALYNSLFIAACTTVVSTCSAPCRVPAGALHLPLQAVRAAAGDPADDHSALPDGRRAAAVLRVRQDAAVAPDDHPRPRRLHVAVRGADRLDTATASTARSSAPPATSARTRRAPSGT